ncbi:MAG: DUF2807 domain-containing protein [Cyclobacteriaceae bacterium]|nr:DUF2807 domain-containing protein [Cyclobacteriaceae bacterium]
MKAAVYFFLCWGSISAVLVSCNFLEDFEKGNGSTQDRYEEVPDFSRVRIGGNFDVTLVPSEKNGVRIITDENLHEFIEVDVRNGQMAIIQQKKLISRNKIKAIIEYDHLEELRVTGAAMIQNEGYIEEKELDLRMDGAGMIDIRVRTGFLKADLSGAGIIKIAGESEKLDLNLSGAGSVKAFDLESRSCKVVVSGLGGAEVNVTENLEASIEGVGGIRYEGNPPHVNTVINGLGKIRPAENN